jgi:hypothetical protein
VTICVSEPSGLLEPIHWYVGRTGEERAPALRAELVRRATLYTEAEHDRKLRAALIERCRRDTAFFFDHFAFAFEPRHMKHYPMVLWPIQRRYVAFVEQAIRDSMTGPPVDWLCDKSRDMGMSYLNCGIALKYYLFVPNFPIGFCSNLERNVDQLGNPSTIFEKIRLMLDYMPWWLRPPGFDREAHCPFKRIINPQNGNVIIGEQGSEAGRGGRMAAYFVDEAAYVDHPDALNRALSYTTNCRGWVSSANGMGNFFYRQRHGGGARVMTVHWRDHPWKDEPWAAAEKRRIGALAFAAEVDIDYSLSTPNLLIERAWVEAAKELWRLLPHPTHLSRTAGLDVGAGRDLSVYQPRIGELMPKGSSLQVTDTSATALWALDLARKDQIERLIYDSVGVGEGVKATFSLTNAGDQDRPRIHPTNWGGSASTTRIWKDRRTSAETFANLKAELCWLLRERFRASHELHLHLTGQPGGVAHDQNLCLLLEPNPELEAELCVVKYRRRGTKIEIEGKDELKQRGIKSPDWFDAAALSMHEPSVSTLESGNIIIGGRLTAATLDI